MFTKSLVAVALVFAAVALPAAAGAATRAGEPHVEVVPNPAETNEHVRHCALEVAQGLKTMDDCQKSPSPIMPEMPEVIWGGLAFVLLFLLLWKFAFPAIRKGMDARAERISNDLTSAENAKAEATGVLAEYQAQLADARAESARIIEEARSTADAMRRDLAAKAEADIAEMRQRAAADVEAAKAQAMADLRGEVTQLAIGAAEHVVQRNLDAETNAALVDQFIAQVGAGRS